MENTRTSAPVILIVAAHGLTGTLEIGKSGLAFYNLDSGHYQPQSDPG